MLGGDVTAAAEQRKKGTEEGVGHESRWQRQWDPDGASLALPPFRPSHPKPIPAGIPSPLIPNLPVFPEFFFFNFPEMHKFGEAGTSLEAPAASRAGLIINDLSLIRLLWPARASPAILGSEGSGNKQRWQNSLPWLRRRGNNSTAARAARV